MKSGEKIESKIYLRLLLSVNYVHAKIGWKLTVNLNEKMEMLFTVENFHKSTLFF